MVEVMNLLTIMKALFLIVCSFSAQSETLVGMVPGIYLGKNKNKFYLSSLEINADGVISEVKSLNGDNIPDNSTKLKNPNGDWLGIYPGLIDLHGHPKQNVLPLWGHAHGQFGNRHEWREWSQYQKDVSGNMNPWSGDFYMLAHCSAFRWAELQAMVLGTVYNQGWSFCEDEFSIFNVERGDGFIESQTNLKGEFVMPQAKVSAPTDLIFPKEFTFAWDLIKPIKDKHKLNFPEALWEYLKLNCLDFYNQLSLLSESFDSSLREELLQLNSDTFDGFVKKNRLKDSSLLPKLYKPLVLSYIKDNIDGCKIESPHSKFKRFMTRILPLIAGKYAHLKSSEKGVVLAHLAEGRSNDPYNKIEIDLLRLVDLDQEGMNLVHANGLDDEDIRMLGIKGMGVIWSPFSNLLLYNETLNIKKLFDSNVLVALGSDWTPTGSKSLLEEVKIAKKFLIKNNTFRSIGGDEFLYHSMITNPAKMLKRLETDPDDGVNGIGSIARGAVASLTITSIKNSNPFSNLVDSDADDIELVMAQGRKIYGSSHLMKNEAKLEKLPVYFFSDVDSNYFSQVKSKPIAELLKTDEVKSLQGRNECLFSDKFFSVPDEKVKAVREIEENFGVDLNSPEKIQKVLGVMLLSKTKNINEEKHDDVIGYFPSLFTCNDKNLNSRITNFIKVGSVDDEMEMNFVFRTEFRKKAQEKRDIFNANDPKNPRVSIPYKYASLYSLDYDVNLGVYGY